MSHPCSMTDVTIGVWGFHSDGKPKVSHPWEIAATMDFHALDFSSQPAPAMEQVRLLQPIDINRCRLPATMCPPQDDGSAASGYAK